MAKPRAEPLIGMPTQMDPDSDRLYLNRQYSDAVAAAGGVPLMIPLLAKFRSIQPVADNLDGILLTGNNSDLDPSLYGSPRLGACGPVQPIRDQMDFFLLESAVRRKIPVLAICYGIQSLNVFLGGSLIQDIPTFIDTPIQHSNPKSKDFPSHKIEISSGSVLEWIAGRSDAMVNSSHHQAIESLGKGLEVVARAPDGVIESVCSESQNHWILGVQWHPERSFAHDDFSRKLFENFLAHCRAVRGINEGTDT